MDMRGVLLATNRDARKAYAKQTGVDESMLMNQGVGTQTITLPSFVFDTDVDLDLDDKPNTSQLQEGPAVIGNLSDLWFKV
jgi:hypothetical protein